MRSDIAPGASFPDYALPDHEDVPLEQVGPREAGNRPQGRLRLT
jgi:hypothetical protein